MEQIDNFVKAVAEQTERIKILNELIYKLCIVNGVCPVCKELVGQDAWLPLVGACIDCKDALDKDLTANKPH